MNQSSKQSNAEKIRPRRGEIWRVDLEPTQGREIQSRKGGANDTRPVMVLSKLGEGTEGVSLCVPITDYKTARDEKRFWRVEFYDAPESGLAKFSCADVSQTRTLDISRFVRKNGRAHPAEVATTALMLAIFAGVPMPEDGDANLSSAV